MERLAGLACERANAMVPTVGASLLRPVAAEYKWAIIVYRPSACGVGQIEQADVERDRSAIAIDLEEGRSRYGRLYQCLLDPAHDMGVFASGR